MSAPTAEAEARAVAAEHGWTLTLDDATPAADLIWERGELTVMAFFDRPGEVEHAALIGPRPAFGGSRGALAVAPADGPDKRAFLLDLLRAKDVPAEVASGATTRRFKVGDRVLITRRGHPHCGTAGTIAEALDGAAARLGLAWSVEVDGMAGLRSACAESDLRAVRS